jgi:LemA protein
MRGAGIVAAVVILAGLLLVAYAIIVSINRFMRQRGLMEQAWANVESELQRRYDLIPALVETVQAYAWHERGTFEQVARARASALQALASSSSPAAQAAADTQVLGALRNLFAVAESHPHLRANENFLHLQHELATTEDRVQAARRFYNAGVADYNRRVRSFPSVLIAGLFGFHKADFYQVHPMVHQMPAMRFGGPYQQQPPPPQQQPPPQAGAWGSQAPPPGASPQW